MTPTSVGISLSVTSCGPPVGKLCLLKLSPCTFLFASPKQNKNSTRKLVLCGEKTWYDEMNFFGGGGGDMYITVIM